MTLLAQALVATLFTGALYDGGGDTWHPFWHLALGARVEVGPVGVEAMHSPAQIRGEVDLYSVRLVGRVDLPYQLAVRAGCGWSRWDYWQRGDWKLHRDGFTSTLGLSWEVRRRVWLDGRWEWWPEGNGPIEHGLLVTLGIGVP